MPENPQLIVNLLGSEYNSGDLLVKIHAGRSQDSLNLEPSLSTPKRHCSEPTLFFWRSQRNDLQQQQLLGNHSSIRYHDFFVTVLVNCVFRCCKNAPLHITSVDVTSYKKKGRFYVSHSFSVSVYVKHWVMHTSGLCHRSDLVRWTEIRYLSPLWWVLYLPAHSVAALSRARWEEEIDNKNHSFPSELVSCACNRIG